MKLKTLLNELQNNVTKLDVDKQYYTDMIQFFLNTIKVKDKTYRFFNNDYHIEIFPNKLSVQLERYIDVMLPKIAKVKIVATDLMYENKYPIYSYESMSKYYKGKNFGHFMIKDKKLKMIDLHL
jgi:hypothetical protein